MSATKVTLRKRLYPSGKTALYLDFYPEIRNPHTNKMTRREYLGIYIITNPQTPTERKLNKAKMAQAEAIRAQRELAIINEQFGFLDKTKAKMDALDYFYSILRNHHEKWAIVYEHFKIYAQGKCRFEDLDVDFCNGFREYLSTAKRIKSDHLKLSQNSAASYWSTFRAFLLQAYKEGYLQENLNDKLEKLETKETRRQYLTLDEVRMLANTPCKFPVLKQASLFSCLTGLRISDILALEWENFQEYPGGGWCFNISTEKTDSETLNPISDEAFQLCGEPGKGKVFKGLTRQMVNGHLKEWISAAGITKYITFHCCRHTYATLLIAGGTDIYTVSKMLTHKNVATTQIYADLVSEKKRNAASVIKITDNPSPKDEK
ncbi:MAG: site-specific integrase [Bacteroidales bacterium]|nr:site-specific integrase [Bacteroidales bacterium]